MTTNKRKKLIKIGKKQKNKQKKLKETKKEKAKMTRND